MPSPVSQRLYVKRVLDLYRWVPGTIGLPRRSDRRLAAELHDHGVRFEIVAAALLITVVRRSFRSPSAPPLAPIATLHYFRPVIEELIVEPPEPGYLGYLRDKLSSRAPRFAAALDHQLP